MQRFARAVGLCVSSALIAIASTFEPATAQTGPATVSGVISNGTGRLGDASLTFTGPITKTIASSADGTYTAAGLPAGTYRVTITHSGYRTAETSVTVGSSDAVIPLSVTLDPASLDSIRTIGRIATTSRQLAVNNTPAAVTVISPDTFTDRGNFQVENILEEQPGVELTRASSGGAPGANTNVAIRGADPYETQTLIDGHPVVGGASGTFLIQFLNPLVLGDTEILKGPGATPNEIQNAIGGSVNFRTPSITPNQTAKVTLGYDSYNGSTEGLTYANTIDGKLGFLVGYGRFGTTGYYNSNILSVSANGNVGTGSVPDAVVNQSVPSTELFDNTSEVAKIGYNFSPATNVRFGYFGSQTYVDYTATLTTVEPVHIVGGPCASCGTFNFGKKGPPLYNNPANANLAGQTVLASTTQDNLYLGNYETDNEPIFTGDFNTSVGPGTLLARYYTGSISRLISDPQEANQISGCEDPTCAGPNTQFSGPFYQREVDVLHGGDLEFDLPIGRNTVTLSYDTYADRATACSGSDAALNAPGDCSVNNVHLFSNTLSARANFAVGGKTSVTLANYVSNTSQVGTRYDPRLGIVFRPNANVALRAAAGTSYAAPYPDVAEHVSSRGTLYAAQNLKPESSFGYNLGADVSTGRFSKFAVDLYNTVIHDRFATVQANVTSPFAVDGITVKNEQLTFNQANTRDAGIEFSYFVEPRVGLGGQASFDLNRAYAYGTNFVNAALAGFADSPFQAGNYGAIADGAQTIGYPYSHGRFALTYTLRSRLSLLIGTTVYGANNSFNEPGFSLFDASVKAPLSHDVQLTFSVQNVFNHDDYRTLGEYAYGIAPPQDAGAVAAGFTNAFNPQSLFFAPPRLLTLQLSRRL